ncbi:MAG TPA: TetR/AcrR family transcriptional regulator [Acidocella sp.]|nr:TetR/AcrR family transcriptional regulator [Acidocella sp.]
MDNRTRSERTREAVLQAALTIMTRDGAGRLTLDAIAKESGVSKGGLLHQFPSKDAVITALLERQTARVEALAQQHLQAQGAGQLYPQLAAHIATSREVLSAPAFALSFAMFGLLAQDPGLLARSRERDARKLAAIKSEAADPDLATLRWLAAKGLVQAAMVGPSVITEEERERLFARLLDDAAWHALEHQARTPEVQAG